MHHATTALLLSAAACGGFVSAASAQTGFVNWESPHVHPLELTPDRTRLLAVNTADNRLEVFDATGPVPVRIGSAPVGLDPVSVRAVSNTEAWVVNLISDSVSIVDLPTLRVMRTLSAGDEPCDVVFAQGKAFVSVSQLNQVWVFNLSNLSAAPTVVPIQGEDPRALATDGTRVYAAIFESGNNSTVLSQQVVSGSANPYPGRPNPPPNAGTAFSPPLAQGLPTPPAVSLIVKRIAGQWMDDNNHNWSGAVTWGLHDHDVAIINATNPASVTYANGLMNANMAVGIRTSGKGTQVTVVGTDAINSKRYEPNVRGIFVRSMMARFNPLTPGAVTLTDLNPHLNYASSSAPLETRRQSVGDPRQIVWNSTGTAGYVAGMGSNTVTVYDGAGARIAQINDVPHGPTGLALDETAGRLYVLGKFNSTIGVISTTTNQLTGAMPFFDPTPASILTGRQYFYGTQITSGLGQASCASCHIDGRTDQLAWDLGDPSGAMKAFNQNCNGGLGGCNDWHPMKGPMTTQTLFGIIGHEPLHWRGDRDDLSQFNGAFVALQGRDAPLEPGQLAALTDFVASLTPPPNPNRNFDGSLKTSLSNGGNPANGSTLFQTINFDGGLLTCVACHNFPTGGSPLVISGAALQETQAMKVPQLRNMHEKHGFSRTSQNNNGGFGFIHDGSNAGLVEFLQSPVFRFDSNATIAAQQRRDLEAFMFSFSTDTHAAVGSQTTVTDGSAVPQTQQSLISSMVSLAQAGTVGVVAKARVAGVARGYEYVPAQAAFATDRAGEPVVGLAQLITLASAGSEVTFTVVPAGSQHRIGIDRDDDGFLDRTELDVCANPADPFSFPGDRTSPDADGSGAIEPADIAVFVNRWLVSVSTGGGDGDFDSNGAAEPADIALFVNAWLAALQGSCG